MERLTRKDTKFNGYTHEEAISSDLDLGECLTKLARYEDAEEENIIEYADISKIDPNMTVYTVPNGVPPIVRFDKAEEFLNTDNEKIKEILERVEKYDK